MSNEMKYCPQCNSPYGYALSDTNYACPECDYNWNPKTIGIEKGPVAVDVNGNEIKNGDTVIVIKDLPVKGAPKPVKAGTKVKNIIIVEGNHDISCKIIGFGAMGLKSEFVKKA